MPLILSNASDVQLAASIEANLFELFRALAALPGSELVESETLSYHDTFPAAPMFKGVWRTRLQASEMDSAIEQMLAKFKARGAPLVTWWFNDSQPAELFEHLKAHGFGFDYNALGMALDLDTIPNPLPLPDGFTMVEARDEKTLDDWSEALFGAYEEYHMPLAAARVWADAALAFGANAPWRFYVGYWNGKPVATNILFNGGGVAGLFCVGTIPEVRGKGLGAAITLQPLLDAQAEGYRYGVLFASEMGIPMYRKVGFREVGINIGRYVWEAAP